MHSVGREFGEGREGEAARGEARVRELEERRVGERVPVEEEIEIDGARRVEPSAAATESVLDAQQAREHLFGRGARRVERDLRDHVEVRGLLVRNLDRLEQVLPAVCALGARHAGYGVREKDYDTVGRALVWALRKGLCGDFTPEAEAAWVEVYAALAGVMKRAQAEATRPEEVALTR